MGLGFWEDVVGLLNRVAYNAFRFGTLVLSSASSSSFNLYNDLYEVCVNY